MTRIRLLVVLTFALSTLFAAGLQPAFAGSFNTGGTLDASDPTLDVAIISTPNCTGAFAGFYAQYEVITFTVTQSGTYTITEDGSPNTAFYLVAGSFTPAALASCLAASNANPLSLSVSLTSGTVYHVVVINDTFTQDPLTYNVTITGPGDINAGGLAGCDALIAIPSTAVGATLVADTPLYWAPGQITDPLVSLQAGKNVRAIGLDATSQYYQILFQCRFLWVPANTLGPNYDAVWNGAPLPTAVVK